jgi:hypothetical protein
MKIRILALTTTLAAAAVAQAGPNLLNNAGFESPLGFDFSNPTNWNGFFGGSAGTFLQAFNDTGAAPNSGAQALVTTIREGSSANKGYDGFTGHVQIVFGITPGTLYELSVFARTNPSINNGAEYRIEWQNGAGTEITRKNVTIDTALSSRYQLFSFTDTAPEGAARAAIVLAVQSAQNNGSAADTSVAWDDASFSVIPAPGVAALFAAGTIFAGRRRR